jgi:uncharacterized membrane protein
MNKLTRALITFFLLAATATSFFYFLDNKKYSIGEIFAPVNINLLMDKNFSNNISLLTAPRGKLFYFAPTQFSTSGNIYVHTKLLNEGFYKELLLKVLKNESDRVISSIENISIFVGNKLFYYSRNDISNFEKIGSGDFFLYKIPAVEYSRSLIVKPWVNYYGDFNLLIKGLSAFLFYPWKFFIVWLLLLLVFFINKSPIYNYYLKFKNNKYKYLIALCIVVFLGFLLRINGYMRHSASPDEIYSASYGSNPGLPFLTVFADPGNPPFYYILLRLWFKLFGWSESAGRLLSVIIGTVSLLTIYCFVSKFSTKKNALLAAFLLAVNTYSIGHSQEMRSYILQIMIVPVSSLFFLSYLKNYSVKHLIFYTISGILLVNTFYFSVLYIFANFVVYILFSRRKFNLKNFFFFFLSNLIIACSFLPFFVLNSFQNALADSSFNNNIEKPSGLFILTAVFVLFLLIVYKFIENKYCKNGKFSKNFHLVKYCGLSAGLIFLTAFFISFLRPVLIWRYLAICIPFIITIALEILVYISEKIKHKFVIPFVFWMLLSCLYDSQGAGKTCSFKEELAFIAKDIQNSKDYRCALLSEQDVFSAGLYNYTIPLYTKNTWYDVLYLPNDPLKMGENDIIDQLNLYKIKYSNILKIRVNDERVVYKILTKT